MSQAELSKLTQYERILVYLFRDLTKGFSPRKFADEIFFDLDDIRTAMHRAHAEGMIPKLQKNVADIKYTFDARRHMPAEAEQCGPITWLQVGKGCYKLKRTRRRNLLVLPDDLKKVPRTEVVIDQTPPFVASLLGRDEQATFTRVRNANLISHVLGFQAWPIQGHHRTTVSYGQIEVDEVQAGLDGNRGTIVPISGKGGQDKLSWSQALNLNTYGREKAPVAGLAVRSIGVWRDAADTAWIVEFSPHLDIDDITIKRVRRFKFQ